MPWSLILLIFLANLFWPSILFVHAGHLSSFGINNYHVIRAIHDETTANHHRRKRSIRETDPDRILTFELDHKCVLRWKCIFLVPNHLSLETLL